MGNQISYEGKHVLITGGSEGIGYALAHCFLSAKARVTILARNTEKLAAAKASLQVHHPDQTIHTISEDVSDFKTLEAAIHGHEMTHGHFDVAVCNAGLSIPGLFVEQDMADVEKTIKVNYFGSHHTVKAVLPGMLTRKSGHICFVSSAAALCGIVGYSSYSPSKAAIRSLADCLRNELQGTGVSVSIAYPPDTKTAGFDQEEITKPGATTRISEKFQDDVYDPSVVAEVMFKGLRRGAYHLPNPDFVLGLLISYTSGLTPSPLGWFLEMLMSPFLVIVSTIIRIMQDRIVAEYNSEQSKVNTPKA